MELVKLIDWKMHASNGFLLVFIELKVAHALLEMVYASNLGTTRT